MSSPLQNIYLLTYIKLAGSLTASMKADLTKQIIKQAINCLNSIPPQKIQKAVILVCKDDDQHISLKSLIGSKSPQQKQAPFGISLKGETILIDPGEYIAYPDKEQNFIIRRYLAKYAKKAKFIFPISLSQISQLSLMSIQSLFLNFFYLFQDLDDLQMGKLADSCGIMALDIKNQQQKLLYKERLLRPNGLLQQGFIKGYQKNIQVLLKAITSKDLIYGGKIEGNIMEQFQNFLQKISFFDYKDRIKPLLPNKYLRSCEQRLQISSIWHSLMTFFYQSIPLLIENKEIVNTQLQNITFNIYEDNITQNNRQNIKISYKLNTKQLQLLVPKNNHDIHSYSFLGNYQPKKIIYPIQIPAIIYSKLILIRLELQIKGIQANQKVPGQSKLMEYFFFLYQMDRISIDIYVFLASYYHIYDYLSTETNDHNNDLISKISLMQIKNQKDFSIIRNCLKLLLYYLQSDQLSLQNCKEIAPYMKKMIDYLTEFKDKLAITSKTLSNLQCHLVNIYYKLLKSQKNKKKYSQNAINLLKYLINCKERHEGYIIDILKDLIEKFLTHQHSYQLGYQIGCLLPQYEVQYIFLAFYEDKIGLCPQKFKFIEQNQKQAILKMYYSDYAKFLLKIGYNQKLRELCITGLQTTRNLQQQQIFRIFLIKAQKENEHQQFIKSSIQKQKEIILSKNIIDRIEKELIYLSII